MRQSLAKSERKKLRQIVGHAGISAINAHDAAIRQLGDGVSRDLETTADALAYLKARLDNFDQYDTLSDTSLTGPERLDRLERVHGSALDDLEEAVQALEAWRSRSFLARLEWLLFGR